MHYTATITSQGQITIPKPIRDAFNITKSTTVNITRTDHDITISPIPQLSSVIGQSTDIHLTDDQLRQARHQMTHDWPRPHLNEHTNS